MFLFNHGDKLWLTYDWVEKNLFVFLLQNIR